MRVVRPWKPPPEGRKARRLRIDRHSGQPRTEIVHDLQLEHAGGERQILNGLHVSGAVRAHGGVGAEHQRAHAEFADHLAKEEAV